MSMKLGLSTRISTACVSVKAAQKHFCTQEGGNGGNPRGFHNEELHNLHSSLDIITMADLKSLRWAGYISHTG
jgi:hypothetical protein